MKKMNVSGGAAMKTLRATVIGSVVGAVLCTILLVVCAWAFVTMEHIPMSMVSQLVLALSALSSFVAGLVAAKAARQRGLVCGALAGLLLFVFLLLAGLLVFGETPTPASMTRLAVMGVAGAIGGFVAVSGKAKPGKI